MKELLHFRLISLVGKTGSMYRINYNYIPKCLLFTVSVPYGHDIKLNSFKSQDEGESYGSTA